MRDTIKLMMGISTAAFDNVIDDYIRSGLTDLRMVGIQASESEPLVKSAVVSYVLSLLDNDNAQLYASAYEMQKDNLRHYAL